MPSPQEESDEIEKATASGSEPKRPLITQRDLEAVEQLEDGLSQARSQIYQSLKDGATVEPGVLNVDELALKTPFKRLVKRASAELASARPRPVDEPSFDGGLTYSELRILRRIDVTGEFESRRVRAIVDRFERLAHELFRDDRERMAAFGSYSMAEWLARRAKFEYHLKRARFLILMREYGVTRAGRPVLNGIYALNREYFAVRQR